MNIRNRTYQKGLSIIEMMILITIGLIILAGLTAIFISNSRARTEIERANRQIENGRYAMQLLSDDVRLAGYYAEFDPSGLTLPGSSDPCSTSYSMWRGSLPLHVQGYDNVTASTIPTCVSDVKLGTDILVIRRVSTCEAGVGDCDPVLANAPYLQASLCSDPTELGFPIVDNSSYQGHYYNLGIPAGGFNLRQRGCGTTAALHRYFTHIYFIANNNKAGDGIPTLKRAELGPGPCISGSPPCFTIVPLVDGIENLQLQYGIDSPTVDGIPDSYSAAPANMTEWHAVVSVKINLLARNTEPTSGYDATQKTFALGYDASIPPQLITFTPLAGDSYKRHAYQSEVRMNNVAGRNLL